jgi:TfoX/Sxy family transcriptional regulator of competence genes
MALNEKLAARLREALINVPHVEEKKMFRGVTFMVNRKMCICVSADELMCRIGAEAVERSLEKKETKPLKFPGTRPLGFTFISI